MYIIIHYVIDVNNNNMFAYEKKNLSNEINV